MAPELTQIDRMVKALYKAESGDKTAKAEARGLLTYGCRKHQVVPAQHLGSLGWILLMIVWILVQVVVF